MPSTTPRMRSFMGAELARKRAGKATKTGMTEQQLVDFASGPVVPKAKKALGRGYTKPRVKHG